MPKSLLGAAATVVATWWAILTTLSLLSGSSPTPLFQATRVVLLVIAAAIISGALCVVLWIYIDRRERRLALVAQDMRGLVSSIGPVPMLQQPPPEAPALPRFQAPDVPDDFYVRWLAHFDRTHPKHTALMRRMMRVMQAHRLLPASPVAGGHGDRTLLQHSLLCGYLMHDLARDFKYDGARSKNTARLVLPLVDPNYRFNPGDPLCVIIGIAHDLGKIESYRYDETGSVVGIKEEHDLTGARMVARMEECWELPDADRFAMMMALAHYHHPQELPLSPDRRAIDDRTIALMELLTLADIQASAIENTGHRMSSADLARKFTTIPPEHKLDARDLFNEFVEQINRKHLINSHERNECLAWFTVVQGASRALILVNEGNMAAAIGLALGIDHTLLVEDGRRILTVTLLGELDKRGYLIRQLKIASGDIVAYNAESALWSAQFNQRTMEGQRPHFGPVVVYAIDPARLPEVASVKHRAGNAVIIRGVFGENRKLGAKKAAEQFGPHETPLASAKHLAQTTAESSPAPPAIHPEVATEGQPSAPTPPQEQGQEQENPSNRPHANSTSVPVAVSQATPVTPQEQFEEESLRVDPSQSLPCAISAAAECAKSADGNDRPAEPSEGRPPWTPEDAEVLTPAPSASTPQDEAKAARPLSGDDPRVEGAASPQAPADPAPPSLLQPVAAGSERPTPREVTAAVVAAINKLGAEVAKYASPGNGGLVITLPCDLLERLSPEIAWAKARHHILGQAARQEIKMKVRLPLDECYALEYPVPTA